LGTATTYVSHASDADAVGLLESLIADAVLCESSDNQSDETDEAKACYYLDFAATDLRIHQVSQSACLFGEYVVV
jgi:hypothetical protein